MAPGVAIYCVRANPIGGCSIERPVAYYLLLRDFARELLKQRLLLRVEFVRMMELRTPT
jgi:hypothetical protein